MPLRIVSNDKDQQPWPTIHNVILSGKIKENMPVMFFNP
jgi:hypothetical protein